MNKYKNFYLWILPFPALVAYLPLLLAKKTVDPDAQIILPNLEGMSGIISYFQHLFSLQTIDFQPLRDLTLSFDLWMFNSFNINTIIIQNFCWWILSCLVIFKIINKLLKDTSPEILILLIVGFSIYPLYVPVVGWGMSRKHLVSFFFILCSTLGLLSLNELSFKNSLKIAFLYFLSVFAQPITILWPVWSFIHLKKKFHSSRIIPFLIPASLVLISSAALNFWYYEYSELFKFFYTDKTSEAFNLSDKVLAIGHYLFQLVLPYRLAFNYGLGDFQVLIGVGFLAAMIYSYIRNASFREFSNSWLSLGLLTIIVILNTPRTLSDSYLLVPGFCGLVVIAHYISKMDKKIFFSTVLPLIGFWIIFSHLESKNWLNQINLAKVSFDRRPSCNNSLNYMLAAYEDFQKGPPDVIEYSLKYGCFKNFPITSHSKKAYVNFLSYMFYHENEIPMELRKEKLKSLAQTSLVAGLSLTGLHLKNGDKESARKTMKALIPKTVNLNLDGKEYHNITANVVHPFCLAENWAECLKITSKLMYKSKKLY